MTTQLLTPTALPIRKPFPVHVGWEFGWALADSLMKLKLIYDRQSVGQSVLVSGTHLGPVTNFSFSLKFPLDSCGFVIL
jgi:hypothetical protein